MLALAKLGAFLLLALTVVFLSVSAYSRSVRREKLENRWDADPQGDAAAREAFIAAGMQAYERGLRRRLVWLVYVVPMVAVIVIVYVTNAS